MQRCDILIIGAGMAGASLAYELRGAGDVLLLERESQPGYHTTGRSAAFYAPSYGNEYIRPLTLASGGFLHTPPDNFAETPLLRPRGALYIARDDQLPALEQLHRDMARDGYQIEPVTAAKARAYCSALRADYVAAALYEQNCFDIDVAALHQAYLRPLTAEKKVLCSQEVMSVSRRDTGWEVATGDEVFLASVIVNAAGAWADGLAAMAGVAPVGLQPLRRTVVLVPGPDDYADDWPLVLDAQEQFYFKPDAGKLLISPADETPSPPCDARPEEIDIALATDRLRRATGIAADRVSSTWAGLRTFAPDRVPVIGFEPGCRGFFWLAGQGGYGIQTAPAIARMAADLIARTQPENIACTPAVDPANYRPGRFRKGGDE